MSDKLEQGIGNIIKKELGLEKVPRKVIHGLLTFLDSQGIVRKVDDGFPQIQSRLTERANAQLILKQGWTKPERLI